MIITGRIRADIVAGLQAGKTNTAIVKDLLRNYRVPTYYENKQQRIGDSIDLIRETKKQRELFETKKI
jgi:hypothetical protein